MRLHGGDEAIFGEEADVLTDSRSISCPFNRCQRRAPVNVGHDDTMPGSADEFLAWCNSQLGVTEHPPESNHVPYWPAVGLVWGQGQPWCAAFYLAGLLAVEVEPVTRSVYVPTIVNDYKRVGKLHDVADAPPGDQVLFHIGKGHTGTVVSIDSKKRTLTTIEGNTSAGSKGSQDNGGG